MNSDSLFDGSSFEVDDSLPPNTMRILTPLGPIDFEVHEDSENGIRLERKP